MGPRGVTTTMSSKSSAPLTAITSRRTSQGTKRSPSRTERPSGPISSTKRSVVSWWPAVIPHAEKPLWPAENAGCVTKQAPQMAHAGVRMWAKYHEAGSAGGRCGSLARMGRPVAVRAPATAQALEAPPAPAMRWNASRSAARRSRLLPARAPGGAETGSQSG